MDTLDRLAIHTITTKAWDLPTAAERFAAAGVRGAGVWREWLKGRPLSESRRILDDAGVQAVSVVRGGFFPNAEPQKRLAATDDTQQALDEAAALGASQVVLVCGADPRITLAENRLHIRDGIHACIQHAQSVGVKLAIEPLHPMYADIRSAVNTLGQANDIIDDLGDAWVGIAADVYHIWWDPCLEAEIARAGKRIVGFHVCDWLSPTNDFLNDRGLMGEGCIRIKEIRAWVESAGFNDWIEVEIFSTRWWDQAPEAFLDAILKAWHDHV